MSDGKFLTELNFSGKDYADEAVLAEKAVAKLPVFNEVKRWLDIYFGGKEPEFIPPIALHGSDFQQEVWSHIREIPYGKTVTYGEIARKIAERRGMKKMSAQAVGGAVGSNPVSIIVPCHRVMGQGGKITGYGGGIWRKERLLELEKVSL